MQDSSLAFETISTPEQSVTLQELDLALDSGNRDHLLKHLQAREGPQYQARIINLVNHPALKRQKISDGIYKLDGLYVPLTPQLMQRGTGL